MLDLLNSNPWTFECANGWMEQKCVTLGPQFHPPGAWEVWNGNGNEGPRIVWCWCWWNISIWWITIAGHLTWPQLITVHTAGWLECLLLARWYSLVAPLQETCVPEWEFHRDSELGHKFNTNNFLLKLFAFKWGIPCLCWWATEWDPGTLLHVSVIHILQVGSVQYCWPSQYVHGHDSWLRICWLGMCSVRWGCSWSTSVPNELWHSVGRSDADDAITSCSLNSPWPWKECSATTQTRFLITGNERKFTAFFQSTTDSNICTTWFPSSRVWYAIKRSE